MISQRLSGSKAKETCKGKKNTLKDLSSASGYYSLPLMETSTYPSKAYALDQSDGPREPLPLSTPVLKAGGCSVLSI